MKKEIKNFVETFNSTVIKESEKHDNVMCFLSGGLDTRCILSSLINSDIDFTCFTYKRKDEITSQSGKENVDVQISKKICLKFNLNQIIENYYDRGFNNHYEYPIEKYPDYFFLSGQSMSEVLGLKDFGKYRFHDVLFRQAPLFFYNYRKVSNHFIPIFEKEVLESLLNVNKKYFRFKFLQYSIIKHNVPELLDIRYTCHRERLFPLLCNLYYSYLE